MGINSSTAARNPPAIVRQNPSHSVSFRSVPLVKIVDSDSGQGLDSPAKVITAKSGRPTRWQLKSSPCG
jgi:hypothetical protein